MNGLPIGQWRRARSFENRSNRMIASVGNDGSLVRTSPSQLSYFIFPKSFPSTIFLGMG